MKRKIRLRDYIYFDFYGGIEGTAQIIAILPVISMWIAHFVIKAINYKASEFGFTEIEPMGQFSFVVLIILTIIAVVFLFVLPIVIGIINYIDDLRNLQTERIKEYSHKENIEHEKTITIKEVFENSGKENI